MTSTTQLSFTQVMTLFRAEDCATPSVTTAPSAAMSSTARMSSSKAPGRLMPWTQAGGFVPHSTRSL